MMTDNRRLDLLLLAGIASFTLLPWYHIRSGFFGFGEKVSDEEKKVIDTLRESLAQDKSRSQVFDISPLGLLEVTPESPARSRSRRDRSSSRANGPLVSMC